MKHEYLLSSPNFTVENINIQNVSRPKNYRHSFRAGRPRHGFIYVISGGMRDVFLAGKEHNICVNAGELIFIPKNTAYIGIYSEDNTEIKIVQFDLAGGTLPDYLAQPVKLQLPRAGELMEAFFEPLESHKANHPFYYLSCLYRLLWQVEESSFCIPAKFKKLQAALSEINEHFDQNEAVSYYAELCDMSEVNFRRLFREYVGMSPIDYRNDIRLNAAKNRLQSGEYNVSEVAAFCGFSNLSFFTRLYKKKFGHTPRQE